MKSKYIKNLIWIIFIFSFFVWTLSAHAVPISFTFSGTGYGTIGPGISYPTFDDVFFTVQIDADTDNIVYAGSPTIPALLNLAGTITGAFEDTPKTYSFVEPLYVFNNQDNQAVGFGNNSQWDLIDLHVQNVGLDVYDLKSSFAIGPVYNPLWGQFVLVALKDGIDNRVLTFSRVDNAYFQATTVPEPTTMLLLGLGLMGLAGVKKRLS
jgi:hypothetical protein